jgi:apolipoprotein N-acyltransferase
VAWLFISMHRYGGMPAPMAAAALALFALYLGLFAAASLAVAGPALRRALAGSGEAGSSLAAVGAALLFAGWWGAGELLRTYLFTGFPWLSSGYAHVDGPLAGLAPIVGVHGVGAFSALIAAALAIAISRIKADRTPALLAALAFIVLPLLLGLALQSIRWDEPTGEPIRVRLLQGNVPQQLKFDAAVSQAAMHAYAEDVGAAPADLVVLPETAWTLPWSRTPAPVAAEILAGLRRHDAIAAIGMPLPALTEDGKQTLSNSVLAVGGDGPLPWRYDKHHLVPFGEFVPFGFGWFVEMMQIPLGDFGRGGPDQAPLELRGQRIMFDICYEDIFGDELAAQVRAGATLLVNVSNIAWFGDSHALPQHLQIARMRAIELARPMLRSTNTGVTAAIDARGEVISRLPTSTRDALAVELRGTTGWTPYARAGDLAPLALVALFALAGHALGRRQQVPAGRPEAAR